jgi:hypothetical protein
MLNSLIGIIASSGGAAAAANSYESIATVTVGSGGASSISFTSIPTTYQHLQLRGISRDANAAASAASLALRFNSNATNYTYHALQGNGSAASAAGATSYTYAYNGFIARNGLTSGIFATNIIDVLDYSNTNKYKTVRGLGGYDANGSGTIGLFSNLYQSTTAITQIDLFTDDSADFTQYSSFALYGIKG